MQKAQSIRTPSVQADIIALVGVRSGSKADTLDRYEFSKGEQGAVLFMQDVTAGIQKQQRAKGLWHFTVSPSMGMAPGQCCHSIHDADDVKDHFNNALGCVPSAKLAELLAGVENAVCFRSEHFRAHGICLEYRQITEQDACCSKERQAPNATA